MPLIRRQADEYYTLYENIDHFYKTGYMQPSIFKDKVIYCNCDDYRWSNYVKFWKDNFTYFNISKLIATNYDIGDGAYIYTYDGDNETIETGRENGSYEYYGDFVTDDTIISTNPPFSKMKDYYSFLDKTNANFYIHSTYLAAAKFYKDLNNIYFCYSPKMAHYKYEDNISFVAASGIMTNIRYDKSESKVTLTKTFNEVDKDFYYEEDFCKGCAWKGKILNVDYCKNLPYDYDDYMAVPITFLGLQPDIRDKYKIYDKVNIGNKFLRLRVKKI